MDRELVIRGVRETRVRAKRIGVHYKISNLCIMPVRNRKEAPIECRTVCGAIFPTWAKRDGIKATGKHTGVCPCDTMRPSYVKSVMKKKFPELYQEVPNGN